MSEHVNDIDLARFHAGTLDRARVEAIGAHVRDCAECAARVWGSPETRRAAGAVARNAAAEEPRRRWIPAAAMLVLVAGLGAYAVWRSTRRPVVAVEQPAPPRPAHPWDALVAAALRDGALEPPASLRELRRGRRDIVRGNRDDAKSVRLLAPVGLAVESQMPLFRWTPGGSVYEVTVARNGQAVAKSGPLTSTSWTPPRPLVRDAQYEWQLAVDRDGKRWRVPPPEEPAARFRVVSDDEARMLAAARASGDRIALGVVAARAGVVDEALAQLQPSPDPRARALAEKIRGW